MTYAIIGAGNVGTALARQFARANLPVAIANTRGAEAVAPRVADLNGVRPVDLDDALVADVIILALPFAAVESLGSRIDWTGKIVIDATNAYGVSPDYLAGRPSSDVVAAVLPSAIVVKTLNQLPAALLAREAAQDNGRRVMFVAGNDDAANETVKALVAQLGFSPIVIGRIDGGGRLIHIPGPLVLHNLVEHPLK